ncbi:hypothetical protein TNCV_2745131 [Trichonephila clavipes]|nr:hypothetical protein TNCV_2745131 [Trichonephila clavipes]
MEKNLHSVSGRAFSTNGKARGGRVMVWGCMVSIGVGKVEYTKSIMNKYDYRDVLKKTFKEKFHQTRLRIMVSLPPIGEDKR